MVAPAAAAAACKVWIRSPSIPCVFGTSIYETIRNSVKSAPSSAYKSQSRSPSSGHEHCDRILVDFEEPTNSNGAVFLSPSSSTTASTETTATTNVANDATTATTSTIIQHRGIPFGRAKDCPTLSSRARQDELCNRRRKS